MARKALLSPAALALAAVFLLSGCGEKKTIEEGTAMTPEGKLTRVEYSFCHGTMYGADFAIDVTADELVSASYFAEDAEGRPEQREKLHAPITAGQWQDIERAVDSVRAILKQASPPGEPGLLDKLREKFGRRETVMDGGDKTVLALTWEKDGREERVEYSCTGDRRFSTLRDVLQETADPIGREIIWYGEPILTGLYFCRESKSAAGKYSYQCSLTGKGEEERYYNVHIGADDHYYTVVYEDVWERIAAEIDRLGIEDLPRGSRKDTLSITLYYDDRTQLCVKPDKETAEALRSFFQSLTEELREPG